MDKKKILIAAIHYPVASGRYIARAFRRLGHEVRTVGVNTGTHIWGTEIDKRHIWKQDFDEYGLRSTLEEWEPELIIIAESSPFMNVDALWTLRNVPLVVWGVDNHVRDYAHVRADKYFFAHHDGPVRPVRAENEHWLPCAYDPEYFTPSPIAWEDRAYDVAMVGVMYPKRAAIVNAMRDAGLTVWAGTGALYEDYAEIYHNARISLCVSACNDVAQRVFETAAMGCALLTDYSPDLPRLGLQEHVHYEEFETIDQVVGQATLMNQNRTSTWLMANAAQAWAQPHTWDARCEELLRVVFG